MGAKFVRTTSAIQKRYEINVLPAFTTCRPVVDEHPLKFFLLSRYTGCHENSQVRRGSAKNGRQCHRLCTPKCYYAVQFLSPVSILLLTRDNDIVILSVRPSVRPSVRDTLVLYENGLTYRHSFSTIR